MLLVRVDATLGDGWFYEGAGIYRHVWLTKTDPVHVPQWGTFVRSTVRPGAPAAVRITTEVVNESDGARNCRVVSKIVDPSGKALATVAATPLSIPAWARRDFEQTVEVAAPGAVVGGRSQDVPA
ncbi:MAG: hypothetical protein WDO73_24120 [Ignavibacteriota bacterium]